MAGSLGAMFVFVFIICVAIIALILALGSHRKITSYFLFTFKKLDLSLLV